jgi:hypothetical protein
MSVANGRKRVAAQKYIVSVATIFGTRKEQCHCKCAAHNHTSTQNEDYEPPPLQREDELHYGAALEAMELHFVEEVVDAPNIIQSE